MNCGATDPAIPQRRLTPSRIDVRPAAPLSQPVDKSRNERSPHRLRRARACARLEAPAISPAHEPLRGSRQSRHRRVRRDRRDRRRRPRRGHRLSAARRASIWSWSARRRRWSPGSSTISPPPESPPSARAARRRGSRARRATPRISAPKPASRPPPIGASPIARRARPICARRKARRSWSRPTGLPPARASPSR